MCHLPNNTRMNNAYISFILLFSCFGCDLFGYMGLLKYVPYVILIALLFILVLTKPITILSNKPACSLLLYEFYMVAICRLNRCGLTDGNYITNILFIICLNEIISMDFMTFLKTAYGFSLAFFLMNSINCVLFKNGILFNDITRYPVYLLGTKNSMGNPIITLMVLNTLYSKAFYNKLTKKVIIVNLIGAFAPIYLGSATTTVGIGLLFIFACVITIEQFKTFLRKISMLMIYIIGGMLSYIFNVLQLQRYFAFFIEVILNRTTTMTARTLIWDKAMLAIGNNKWLGYGVYPINLLDVNYFVAANAHSFFLEVFMTGGIVGVCILAYIFTRLSDRRVTAECKKLFDWIKCYIIIVVAVMGITESTIYNSGLWIMITIGGYLQIEGAGKKHFFRSRIGTMMNRDAYL